MDERELANHVLEIVDNTAYRIAARRVVAVRVAVGGRRPVDLECLRRIFGDAARGTVAEGAQLLVEILPVEHHCQNCGNNFQAEGAERPCPACGHPRTEMVGGEELRLLNLDIDDTAA